MVKSVHISKLDAAKRQLEMAIRLFLSNSDIIAIHTLSAAAHQLLMDLGKKNKVRSLIKDKIFNMINPEMHEDFRKRINEAENFFKHANKDHDRLLKFYFGATEWFLWDACKMYQHLAGEGPPLICLFTTWFLLKNSDGIIDEKAKELANKLKIDLDPDNKGQFLELLPEIMKIKN